jgi:hypothetical protein
MTIKQQKKEHKEHQEALKPLLKHLKRDENKMKSWKNGEHTMRKKNAHPMPKAAPKKQSKNARLDESLGMRRGKESAHKQSYASRRDESRGAKKK